MGKLFGFMLLFFLNSFNIVFAKENQSMLLCESVLEQMLSEQASMNVTYPVRKKVTTTLLPKCTQKENLTYFYWEALVNDVSDKPDEFFAEMLPGMVDGTAKAMACSPNSINSLIPFIVKISVENRPQIYKEIIIPINGCDKLENSSLEEIPDMKKCEAIIAPERKKLPIQENSNMITEDIICQKGITKNILITRVITVIYDGSTQRVRELLKNSESDIRRNNCLLFAKMGALNAFDMEYRYRHNLRDVMSIKMTEDNCISK